jgi:hypothetical protein
MKFKFQKSENSAVVFFAEARQECSAELHSAVSPICNRRGFQRTEAAWFSRGVEFNSAIRQIENLRYS